MTTLLALLLALASLWAWIASVAFAIALKEASLVRRALTELHAAAPSLGPSGVREGLALLLDGRLTSEEARLRLMNAVDSALGKVGPPKCWLVPLAALLCACPRPSASVTRLDGGVEVVCNRRADVRMTFVVPGMPDTTTVMFVVRAGDAADLRALHAAGTDAMVPAAAAPWVGSVLGWRLARGTSAAFYGGGGVIASCDDPGTSRLEITAPLVAWEARP